MGQNVSELWKTLWNMRNTRHEYAFEISGVWYGSDHEVEHSADGALFEDFGIGNAYIASLALGLYANDVPKGAEIRRYVRLVNGDIVSEWLPKGVFFAKERKEDGVFWNVSAMDAMRKADIVWKPDQSLVFPLPMRAAVNEFCRIMGVELDDRSVISEEYTIDYPANDYTIRNELEFIAAAHGGNFIMSEVGKLRMLPLISAPKETNHLVNERGAAILIGGAAILVGDAPISDMGQSASEKYFVGADLVASSNNGKYKPVSRITLAVDDSNVITAGDDSGMELYAFCPHATQKMVDALLEKLRGYTYQAFEADEANLNPSAELGDGITVGGIYGVISKLRYDGSGYVGISAPGKAELEDGYPMEGPMTQMINRQLAGVRSSIAKTAEQIRAEVSDNLNGLSASVNIELGRIRQEVQGAEDAISYLEVDLEAIAGRVQDAEGNIGALEISAETIGGRLEDAEGNITKLELSTEEIEAAVGEVSIKINALEGLTVTDRTGTTYIKGSSIETDSIYANALHLGGFLTVYKTQYGESPGGYLGYDSGFYGRAAGIGIRSENEYSQIVCTDLASRMSYSDDDQHITQVVCGQDLALSSVGSIQFSIGGNVSNVVAGLDEFSFYPAASLTLGTSFFKWSDVFAAGTSMSDLLRRVAALEAKQGG